MYAKPTYALFLAEQSIRNAQQLEPPHRSLNETALATLLSVIRHALTVDPSYNRKQLASCESVPPSQTFRGQQLRWEHPGREATRARRKLSRVQTLIAENSQQNEHLTLKLKFIVCCCCGLVRWFLLLPSNFDQFPTLY